MDWARWMATGQSISKVDSRSWRFAREMESYRATSSLFVFSLGLAIAVLAPVLSFISGFYLRFVDINNQYHDDNMSIIEFNSLLFNCAFLLSHLTNQGIFFNWIFIKICYSMLYNKSCFWIKRLPLRFETQVSWKQDLSRNMVFDDCRSCQRLCGDAILVHVSEQIGTTH